MAVEHFRHIYLGGPDEVRPFATPQSGGSLSRSPTRDRYVHANLLERRFNAAWDEADVRRAVRQTDRDGVYLEFASEPGFQLMLKSIEDLRSGIRLLNVRRREVGGQQETLATVFVPKAKRSCFLRKIKDYATRETAKGRPRNAALIDSICDVRLALLESFWRPADLDRIPSGTPEWVELWIRADDDSDVSDVDSLLSDMQIPIREESLVFPERVVRLVKADRAQIESVIERFDWVAEFRPSTSLATHVLRLENQDQVEQVRRLLARCEFEQSCKASVCLLDTGVNQGHPLLGPVVREDDLHAARDEWGTDDHNGHGTKMAGTAAYGNILDALRGSAQIRVQHCIESAKILPPPPQNNRKELWGAITSQGINLAEIQAPGRRRVVCMAVTSVADRKRGHPSSWSAEIDSLASGYLDDMRRLIVVSAGNADEAGWSDYPVSNQTDEVHDPAQAWNALTVGGYTDLARIQDPDLADFGPIAAPGGLSPHSTSSCSWTATKPKWPIKPEVVFESGNLARGTDGFVTRCDDLELISTSRDPQVAQFASFGQTSAAAAQAAYMAVQLSIMYPQAWPETIRAAIVHSAEWTAQMKQDFPASNKAEYELRARLCGYGVPDLERAAYCLRHSLTLVSQSQIQPFGIDKGRPVTRDMHLYRLPWPTEVLTDLASVPVRMRVTLSYFVEPGPGEVGWQDRYRYASHGLRFAVNGPGESEQEFTQRVNRRAREDGEHPRTEGPSDHWVMGQNARDVGSIHTDTWEGRAADLAVSNLIAVFPTIGWWRERKNQDRVTRATHYALLVSVMVPTQGVDIYTPVAAQIGVPVEVATT